MRLNSKPRSGYRSLFSSIVLLTFTFVLTANQQQITLADAQSSNDVPSPAWGAAFARTATKLYVLGGKTSAADDSPTTGQFFLLDLATPWAGNAPAWKRLQSGPMQSVFPGVFTVDQKTMIVFHISGPNSVYRYNVDTNAWSTSPMVFPAAQYQGVGAVTDPGTGLVYLAGGYTDANRGSIDVFNPGTDTATQDPLPNAATTFGARWYYSNVWCQQRKSILYFGGYNVTSHPGPANNVITELVPSTKSWGTMSTSGTPPAMRSDHCMAANDDGTKVIIYGGRLPNNAPFSGEVFILNTVTGVWTQGASGPPRLYTTCTIAGDQLLIWGGNAPGPVLAPYPVSIYNIATNTWVTDYTPPASYVAKASASATAGPSSTAGDSSSNLGGIIGGVVGALAVIGAIVGFLLYRRRRQHGMVPVKTTSDHEDNKSLGGAHQNGQLPTSTNNHDEEFRRMQSQLENQQQQLELQRQLLALQQQQQFQSPTVLIQQDPSVSSPYGYQPPIYYPPAPNTANTVQTSAAAHETSYAYTVAVPTVGGHSEIYQTTTEPSYAPSQLVYMPADYGHATSSMPMSHIKVSSSPAVSTTVATVSDISSSHAIVEPVKKSQLSGPHSVVTTSSGGADKYVDGTGSWERPHNNPHTILE
ncbi:hypothetical protein BGX29_004786 [Mortierella sp. GBA35]|nr:hypothetical protein BGX29_004786 [Mortierella sp. GBA35]